MPLDAPEGGISYSEDYLRTTLANCARFRTWAGVADVPAALAKIFPCGVPEPDALPNGSIPDSYTADQLTALRPFALLWADENNGWRTGRVATEAWDEAGQLFIALEQAIDPALVHDRAGMDRRFKNHLGVIANELTELAYQGGFLAIDQIIVRGPWRAHPDDVKHEGDHLFAHLQVTWGLGRGV
jgi:hypothetical protein